MEKNTDFNDIQEFYLSNDLSNGLGQNRRFAQLDFTSQPNSNSLQDFNIPLTNDNHQINSVPTVSAGDSLSEQPFNQQYITHNALVSQYPSVYDSSGQYHANHLPSETDNLFSSFDQNPTRSSRAQFDFETTIGYEIMMTETPETAAPIEVGYTAGDVPALRCTAPDCSPDREYPSESALRKHEAKHSKPYICYVPNCKHTRFGDKGGLDRHNREVHGSTAHYCPVTSCKRHVKGFPRKYNLFEHQKRCHSFQSPNLAPSSTLGQEKRTNDSMKGKQEPYVGSSSPEIVTGGGGRLREKLESLYKMRAEIDVDIQALKRSLNLLGEDFPDDVEGRFRNSM